MFFCLSPLHFFSFLALLYQPYSPSSDQNFFDIIIPKLSLSYTVTKQMNMTQQELFKAFESLPAEAQRQALNFIAFLQQTYAPVTVSPNIAVKSSDINAQHQKLTLNDLISTIPNNFTYPDDVMEFTESEPLGRELL